MSRPCLDFQMVENFRATPYFSEATYHAVTMNSNLVIVLIGTGILLGLCVLWVWHYLFQKERRREAVEHALIRQFEERRDLLPYLLESYRSLEPKVSPYFGKIVAQRAETRNATGFTSIHAKEQLLGAYLEEFLKETQGHVDLKKDIGWLEVRRDLQKMEENLKNSLKQHHDLINTLNEKRRHFPYRLFGGRN